MFSESQLSILVACNFWKKLVHHRRKKQSCLEKRHFKLPLFSFFFFFSFRGAGSPNGLCVVSQGRGKKSFGNVYGNA